jgi:hypothetical protein
MLNFNPSARMIHKYDNWKNKQKPFYVARYKHFLFDIAMHNGSHQRIFFVPHFNGKLQVFVFFVLFNILSFYFLFTERIDFVLGKSKNFHWSSGRIKTSRKKKNPSVRRLPSAVRQRRLSANLVIRITFFPFNLDTSPFQVKINWT